MCGTNRGQMGPVPGTHRPLSVEFHSKIAILSRLSPGRVPSCPWDDCPARAVRKMFMCFVFFVFFPESYESQYKSLKYALCFSVFPESYESQ